MLKIAIPNKGSLSEESVRLLRESGYKVRCDPRQLVLDDPQNDVQFFYLRPKDIAIYVGKGTIDLGITGLDLLKDATANDEINKPQVIKKLGFAASTFRFACKKDAVAKFTDIGNLNNMRIATSYAELLNDYLINKDIKASIVKLDGAVESAISLGVADVIADVVSTGTTLRGAGLEVFGEPILESEVVLIAAPSVTADDTSIQVLISRLEGVITAREYILMDYDILKNNVDKAVEITPGFASPTISELSNSPDWCAIRSLVPKKDINITMDKLSKIGAKAILTTQILNSRL